MAISSPSGRMRRATYLSDLCDELQIIPVRRGTPPRSSLPKFVPWTNASTVKGSTIVFRAIR